MSLVDIIRNIGRRIGWQQNVATAAESVEMTPIGDKQISHTAEELLAYTSILKNLIESRRYNQSTSDDGTRHEKLEYTSLMQLLGGLDESVRIRYTPLGFFAIFCRSDEGEQSPRWILDFIKQYLSDGELHGHPLAGHHYSMEKYGKKIHFIYLFDDYGESLPANVTSGAATLEYVVSKT